VRLVSAMGTQTVVDERNDNNPPPMTPPASGNAPDARGGPTRMPSELAERVLEETYQKGQSDHHSHYRLL
jgi:hypothetical protein